MNATKHILCVVPSGSEWDDVEEMLPDIEMPFGELVGIQSVIFYGVDPKRFMRRVGVLRERRTEFIVQQYESLAAMKEASVAPEVLGAIMMHDIMHQRNPEALQFLVDLARHAGGKPTPQAPIFNSLDASSNLLDEELLNQILSQERDVALITARFKSE